MRARRIAVRRDEGRRRLRRVAVLAVLAVVAGLVYLTTRSPLLDVDHVRITGATHTTEATLLDAAGIRHSAAMTDIDLGKARAAIAALPWIDTVSVTRRWPSSVTVHVTERTPAAAVLTASQHWLVIDGSGRVLDAPVAAPGNELPRITVTDDGVVPGQTLTGVSSSLAVASLLTPDLKGWIVSINPGDGSTLELALKGQIVVRLGSPAHLADKLVDLATVLTRVDLTDLQSIDLEVVHTPVLTRKAGRA